MPSFDSSHSGYKFIKESFLRDSSKSIRGTLTWQQKDGRGGDSNVYCFEHATIITSVRGMFRFRGSVSFFPEVGRFSKLSFVVIGGAEGAKPKRLLGLDFQLPGDKFHHSFNETVIRQSHWHSYHEEYADAFATNYVQEANFDVSNWLNLANEALQNWAIAPLRPNQWDVGQVKLALKFPGVSFGEGM